MTTKKSALAFSLSFFVLAGLCPAMSALAQDFEVSKKISSCNVMLSNLSVTLDAQTFVAGKATGSATFTIRGQYESPRDFFEDLHVRVTPDYTAVYPNEMATIELLGQAIGAGTAQVELGEESTSMGSSGKFEIPVSVTLNGWSSGQTAKTWTYHITSVPHAMAAMSITHELVVTFDIATGWSYTFK